MAIDRSLTRTLRPFNGPQATYLDQESQDRPAFSKVQGSSPMVSPY
jgi:hypothetical protein